MKDTLSVKELIEQLKKVDENLPVIVSGVGFSEQDSWDALLEFGDLTVDVYNNQCRIKMSVFGS
jgi:hypothetical protein